MNNLILGILFIIIMFGLSNSGINYFSSALYYPCYSLWGFVLIEIVINRNKSPDTLTQF